MDPSGKSIFPDATTGQNALHAEIIDQIRLGNAPVSDKIHSLCNEHGIPNAQGIIDGLNAQGIPTAGPFSGPYITGEPPQQIPTADAKQAIINAIAAANNAGNVGSESPLECPGGGSGSLSAGN